MLNKNQETHVWNIMTHTPNVQVLQIVTNPFGSSEPSRTFYLLHTWLNNQFTILQWILIRLFSKQSLGLMLLEYSLPEKYGWKPPSKQDKLHHLVFVPLNCQLAIGQSMTVSRKMPGTYWLSIRICWSERTLAFTA